MTKELQRLLESLPADEPRSHLEPYRELILRLRRQGRSYRRIRQVLADQCGVRIAYGPLYRFVQRRSRPRQLRPDPIEENTAESPLLGAQLPALSPRVRRSPEELAALRAAASAANHKPVFQREDETRPVFVYHPDRPLTNKPNQKEK